MPNTTMTATNDTLSREQSPPPGYRWVPPTLVVGAVVLLTVLQLLRQAGVPSWQTVWAEDGPVFLQGAPHLGSLFTSYAGYEQLAPRLIALGSEAVPATQLARYLSVSAALITALLSVSVYRLAATLVPSRVLRGVLVLGVAFVPAAITENLASAVNVNWPFVFVCYWAILFRPSTKRDVALAGSIAFLAATSNVLTALYLPLALLLAWKRTDAKSRTVLAIFGVGLAIQGLVALLSSDPSPEVVSHATQLPQLFSVRVLGSVLVGDKWIRSLWLDLGDVVAWVAAAIFIALIAFLVSRTVGSRRCLGLITIGYSILLFCYPVDARGTSPLRLSARAFSFAGGRFATLSILLLLSGLFVLVSGAAIGAATRKVAIAVIAVQFAVVGVVGFRTVNSRSTGPRWLAALAGARLACQKPGTEVAPVAISPPGIYVNLPCSRIDR